ncbi:hypothetical protein BIV57_13530 [Mangrovactinospora gilvigrisea]|uniref:ParB-like N-terminal domain-containing protein n=1 Tax=Mangrovactinospora gilvigrisea TaxID=1428644 RepID=A0A1J7C644_9ACTN|nr:ParB/RepB/Spo0J family partition protein [Mangrovactinospora gilvigrisea]OIV37004.1 hypothetical protein BIV57_13530 [Mangrovactinospora gilvigrisea]
MSAPPETLQASGSASMVHLAEVMQRYDKLRHRRFEMLPMRGAGAVHTEVQPRLPGDATAPADLADLISSIGEVGLLQPVLAEEIVREGREPQMRLVAGERRLRAMRWGAVHTDSPHFQTVPAVVCPGPLSEEERRVWQLVENLAREPLKPGEQAAALMFQRCALLVGKLLRAGRPVPREVYAIADPIERFHALEKIRGTDRELAAPWPEVLTRLGLQLDERRATELVRAFAALPRELTLEMDEAAIRLNTRIRFARLQQGRAEAAAEIWSALKDSRRLELLPIAVTVGLQEPGMEPAEVVQEAEARQEQANAARRAKLVRGGRADQSQDDRGRDDPVPAGDDREPAPEPDHAADSSPHPARPQTAAGSARSTDPAGPASCEQPPTNVTEAVDAAHVQAALEAIKALAAQLRAGRHLDRYDRGSLNLAVRELHSALADTPEREGLPAA